MSFLTEGREDREGVDAFMFCNPWRSLRTSVQTMEILDAWGFGGGFLTEGREDREG